MESCLYTGQVVHRRRRPIEHAFRFPLYLFYLDLDELDQVFGRRILWSHRRAAPSRFHRADHLGDPDRPLTECVRDEVERSTGRRPTGPIRLLTQLRHAGYVFNPISVFYCFGPDGRSLEHVVAEVTSTPWKERHCYVLTVPGSDAGGGRSLLETDKQMHVSPFLEMGMKYRFTVMPPADALGLSIECLHPEQERLFDAHLSLVRREIDTASLLGAALRFPLITTQVMLGIHWQALRLWWKGAPFHPHPERSVALRAGPETRP